MLSHTDRCPWRMAKVQTATHFFIAMLLLLGGVGISATGCGDQSVASVGPVDYLVLFASPTPAARVNEIVQQTNTFVLSYPLPGFHREYKIRVPSSMGFVEDRAMFRRFPEVEVVTLAGTGQFH